MNLNWDLSWIDALWFFATLFMMLGTKTWRRENQALQKAKQLLDDVS